MKNLSCAVFVTRDVVAILLLRSSLSLTSSARNISTSRPEPIVKGNIHAIVPAIAPPIMGRRRRPSENAFGPTASILCFNFVAILENVNCDERGMRNEDDYGV